MRLVILAVLGIAAAAYFYRTDSAEADVTDVSLEAGEFNPPASRRPITGRIPLESTQRVLNEAGLPVGPPLESAEAIPVAASPGHVVGYGREPGGAVREIRAVELSNTPANSPGSFAVVDMWADGGPTVVAPMRTGPSLTEAQVLKHQHRANPQGRAVLQE